MEIKQSDNNFLIEVLDQDQLEKTQRHLQFISSLTEEAKKYGIRIVIHGGYAVDGSIGKVTRPHNDIDIQMYGNSEDGLQIVKQLVDLEGVNITDKKVETFYHNYYAQKDNFRADIYYIRLKNNPFEKHKIIIKNDGTEGESHEFETQIVTLNGVSYEAVLPSEELNDKVTKREKGYKPRKEIDQDIKNLKLLLKKRD